MNENHQIRCWPSIIGNTIGGGVLLIILISLVYVLGSLAEQLK